MDLRECIEDYLTDIECRNFAKRTLKCYKVKLNAFHRWCESQDIEDAEDIKMTTLRKYVKYKMDKGNKPSTINGELKTLKTFFQYCWDNDFGCWDTSSGRKFPWVKQARPRVLPYTAKEVRILLNACSGADYYSVRDKAILTLAFETGARCAEIFSIKDEDIYLDEGYILLHGKGSKKRSVPVSPILKKEILRYRRCRDAYFENMITEPYLFLSRNGRQLNNNALEKMIRKRGALLDGEMTPRMHRCRHTFAQRMLMQGTDLYSLQRMLGHSSLAITEVYLAGIEDKTIIETARSNSVLMNLR